MFRIFALCLLVAGPELAGLRGDVPTPVAGAAGVAPDPGPPQIITSYAQTDVYYGQKAYFGVSVFSLLAPTIQWQRIPAGGTDWTDLSENSTYSGVATQ